MCLTFLFFSNTGQVQQPVKQDLGFNKSSRVAESLVLLVIVTQLCNSNWNFFNWAPFYCSYHLHKDKSLIEYYWKWIAINILYVVSKQFNTSLSILLKLHMCNNKTNILRTRRFEREKITYYKKTMWSWQFCFFRKTIQL